MAVNDNGKYTKLTENVVNKLEEIFALDGTVEEACLFADISKQTYYNWINSDPQMKARFDALRNTPVLEARRTVVKGLKENYSNAMDYLSRKKKLEFSTRTEHTGADGGSILGSLFDAAKAKEISTEEASATIQSLRSLTDADEKGD